MSQILESFILGGVDSRSNTLQQPSERALRCKNWVPEESGVLRLRHGYSRMAIDAAMGGAITSIEHFKTLSGSAKYLLCGVGTSLKKYDLAANTTSTIATGLGSGKWRWAKANNRLYGVNNSLFKWYDGTNFRDAGLAEVDSTIDPVVAEGVREQTSAEATAVGITGAASGTFPADTYGRLVYVAYYDKVYFERGPSTNYSGSGRIKPTLNQKLSLTGLKDLSTVDANWVKLLAVTADGGSLAYFATNTSTALTSIAVAAGAGGNPNYTVISTAHGLSSGDIIAVDGVNSLFYVTAVTDANTVQVSCENRVDISDASGNVKRLVQVANATTTGEITGYTVTTAVVANENRGVAASTVTSGTGVTAGYQFHVANYDVNYTNHVGNRKSIGSKLAPTTRCNVRITNLPASSTLLVGRTGDGGQIPYAVTDLASNWIYYDSNTGSPQYQRIIITDANIDGNYELPTRNSKPPALKLLCRVGNRFYGVEEDSYTIRRSASESDSNQGKFTGDPFQSWSDADIETFPTAEPVIAIAEVERELACFSKSNMAVLTDLAGYLDWRGPFNVGIAGPDAFIYTPYGGFWVTGEKQLATVIDGNPVPVSSEYEKALLSQIGDAYLSETQVSYIRDVVLGLDHVVIKARKSDGSPFRVIHDFKLKDSRSPDGQGYEDVYVDALASDYVISQVRDANDKMMVVAGGSDGYLYQLYDGDNDNGTEYSADYIGILYAGHNRTAINLLQWVGDRNVSFSIGKTLKTSLTSGDEFQFDVLCEPGTGRAVPGSGEPNFHYEASLPAPELRWTYVRIQLDSHSDDGTLALNDPPHIPLEDYGRVYLMMPQVGTSRGAR